MAGMPLRPSLSRGAQYSGSSITARLAMNYAPLSSDAGRPIDDIVERAGLTSSDVLARPFDYKRKGLVGSIAGKIVPQDIIVGTGALRIAPLDQKG